MKATELMQKCLDRIARIERMQADYEAMEEAMTSLAAATDQTVRGALGDRFAAYAARRDDLHRAIKKEERLYAVEQVAIILLTQDLPGRERDSLRLYYCKGRTAKEISAVPKMTCDVRTVERYLQSGRAAMERTPEWEVECKLPRWYPIREGRQDA